MGSTQLGLAQRKYHMASGQEFCRIIDWFGLEVAFKGHLFHTPCNEQGHLHLDQVAQSPILRYILANSTPEKRPDLVTDPTVNRRMDQRCLRLKLPCDPMRDNT